MVAAFWDDLKTNSSSKVFKHIADDHVIIEWMDMKTHQHNDNQTFQVILYDSATPTGDGEIKIQYKDFNNTTNGEYTQYTPYHGCYSTVGIENHQATIGLEYTFDNKYPDASAHLEDQSALFITTRNTTVLTSGDVNQDDEINILDIVMVINHILVIEELDSIGEFVADMDGNYILINVPVGTFDVTASMLSYGTQVVSVDVIMDATQWMNFTLDVEAIEGDLIRVSAEKPLVEKGATSKKVTMGKEAIEALPIRDVSELYSLQSGVVKVEGGMRGLFIIEVEHLKHLQKVTRKVQRVKGVISVERKESFGDSPLTLE